MRLVLNVRKPIRINSISILSAIGSIGVLLLSVAYFPALAAEAEKSSPVKIAVFDFELEDVSPGSDDGWASGVRMLIKHQILVSVD